MSLPPGTRIGAFEILAQIGVGGMGEVYRAKDSKLKRDVAIKVLPPEVAGNAERLARFQREAEVLASLNHPHIAQIYGVEDGPADGGRQIQALVMELVDGPTLSERMSLGPIPFDEAQPIALQIVDALAYAHEHNVVHRDLKPSNVKLTADGAVKVLDFGLAKALDPLASGGGAVGDSPTITSPVAMTRAGMFIGTAAYMAPEQARGAVVDKRADIWAFGVVLFEMLSGKNLFSSETVTDTLANVLKTEIGWSSLPPETPAAVRRLLRHCLARDRKHRLQDIGDARIELAEAGTEPDSRTAAPRDQPARGWLRALAWLAAGAVLAVAGVAAWSFRNAPTERAEIPFTFLITPRDGVTLDDPPMFALSPDGKAMVLRGTVEGSTFLHVRSMTTGAIQRLESTRGVGNMTPFWSPDSKFFAFARSNMVFRVGIDGSGTERISGNRASAGAWGADNTIAVTSGDGVRTINLQTQAERLVAASTANVAFVGAAALLPDRRGFLVADVSGNTFYGTLDESSPIRRLISGTQPAYLDPGWLLVVDSGRLQAYPFDAAEGAVRGDPIVLRTDVRPRGGAGGRLFSASTNGVLAIREEPPVSSTSLTWFDRRGVESGAFKLDRHCRNPEFSPKEDRVAMECFDTTSNALDIWVYDVARDAASRLTTEPSNDSDPLWSPDGRLLLFASSRSGAADVYQKNSNGVAPESLVLGTPAPALYPHAWSADGKHVALMVATDVAVLEINGEHTLKPIVSGPSLETEPQFSRDGRYFSYSSDESGRNEIYVQPWPPNGERWQVSTAGGADARWRHDSRELYYLSPARELMAAQIETGKNFKVSAPVRLFQTLVSGPIGAGHRFPYAVARDGRFLMYVSKVESSAAITVILNWTAFLKQ